jgi:hypothetical protein
MVQSCARVKVLNLLNPYDMAISRFDPACVSDKKAYASKKELKLARIVAIAKWCIRKRAGINVQERCKYASRMAGSLGFEPRTFSL